MPNDLLATALVVLAEAFFLHLAAKLLAPRPRFLTAVVTALVGGVVAGLIVFYVHGALGLLLALVVWGFVAATFYRIGWLRAVLLGITAGVLFLLARWLVLQLIDAISTPGRGR